MENESSICLWIKEKLLLVFMYQYLYIQNLLP